MWYTRPAEAAAIGSFLQPEVFIGEDTLALFRLGLTHGSGGTSRSRLWLTSDCHKYEYSQDPTLESRFLFTFSPADLF